MPVSEPSLRKYIKPLVEEYGALSVKDLNIYLREILFLDEEDLQPLDGRSDDKFSQIVRNLVSHAPQNTISEMDGYLLDKTTNPATFYAKNYSDILAKNEKISETEIKVRRDKKSQFKAKKVDYKSLNEEKSKLGLTGELFALSWEQNRLKDLSLNFNVLEEVIHVSEKYGDGAGYDILSKKDDASLLYIEVKTTKGNLTTPFYMSENEKLFMEINQNDCFIYRVYNFNPETELGEIEIISYSELVKNYSFNPITYMVTKNKNY